MCPATMRIYWNKRKCLHKTGVQLPHDWFGKPTWLAVSLFCNTNMASMTSCAYAPYVSVVTEGDGPVLVRVSRELTVLKKMFIYKKQQVVPIFIT